MPEWPFSRGEMADRIRSRDWARSSLGPIDAWPDTLRTAIDMMLAMPGTATLLWGPDAVQFCNDAYIDVARDRHPDLLGKPVADGWSDLYDTIIAPLIAAARSGRASVLTDIAVPLNDPARPDADRLFDTHWSPVYDPDGTVAGILQTMTDVTRRRAERTRQADERRYRTALESQVETGAAALKRSAGLLAATMDSSLDMIQVFEAVRDGDGAIVDFRWILNNHTSEARYGDVIGESLLRNNPGVVAEGIFDAFRRVVDTGVPDQSERRYVHEQFDGWFFQSVVKLGDGVATTTKDISDWKAAQADVRRLEGEMAESRLRKSEERLALAFRTLPVGVAIVDADGRLVMSNDEMRRFMPSGVTPSRDPDAAARWTGYGADGLPIDPRDFPGARTVRGESVAGIDMIYRGADGTATWTQVSAAPLLDDRGRVDGAFSVVVDIDRLKRSEAETRKSEDRLRRFGDASRDVLWMRDAETLQWRYLTPAFETIYGLSRDEVLAGNNFRSWLALVVQEDRGVVMDAMRRLRAGEHVTFDYRIRRPSDGVIRWLRDTDFPMPGANGAVTFIGGIGADITEARTAQDALRSSEERLRSAVEVGRLGLWDWNVATGDVHWSDEHFRMEGYAVGEVKPSYEAWRARVHPDDRADAEAALQAAMDEGSEYAREFRVVHDDGAVRWLSGRGRFFYDDAGRPVRMIGAMVDTTERREWEERQAVLIAELQHRTRNLMGVVRAVADKTARGSADLADFGKRFGARLDALSRVQGLLSRLVDHDRVTFDDLVRTELSAMDGTASRVTTEGPQGVRLRSSTVQTLAMAIHELATNAIKYGALAQADGRLAIRWHVEVPSGDDRPWLHIDWRESGVAMPAADRPARGTGQGRDLIEQALPYQLNARTTYAHTADGVHCTISIPVSGGSPPGHRPA